MTIPISLSHLSVFSLLHIYMQYLPVEITRSLIVVSNIAIIIIVGSDYCLLLLHSVTVLLCLVLVLLCTIDLHTI